METTQENKEGDYTILPCSKCGQDFKKDAIDFLTGLGDEGNTICPECSKEPDTSTSTEMPEPEVKYINYYKCVDGYEWEEVWSCACNSRCPKCNSEIEPYKSEEIPMNDNDLIPRQDVEGLFNLDSEDPVLVCLDKDVRGLENKYRRLIKMYCNVRP